MGLPHSQRGMSGIGWMFVLALIGFFSLVAIRLVPIYIDGYKVSSSLESLRSDGGGAGPAELRRSLLKRLDINMVAGVEPQDIFIEPRGGFTLVNVAYEVRSPLFGNIDLVVTFDETVEVPGRP